VAQVKGTLFVDYVRMLRSRKDVDFSRWLAPHDLDLLRARIEPDAWYPMSTFERMGLTILAEIAQDNLELVKQWGRYSIDALSISHPNLVAKDDPRESLMRFQVLRQSFFDYPALVMREIHDGEASVQIAYGMCDRAEEAASWQTLGFFERLLEVSGARDVVVRFTERSWNEHETKTIVSMRWTQ